ncbi:MAG TPA: ABC transporter ATP-binding protein [Tepidisphaeraceae bacterium]|nr:ABC transporter ATP-binding protein [Tepidisphaeraceae bacterium]
MIEALRVQNLDVSIGQKSILTDISFSVQFSEIVAIVGPNGSGKSTLLKAAIGLLPSHGSIAWFRYEVKRSRSRLHAYPAYVPQSPTVIEGLTVFETILLARSSRLFLRPKDVEGVEWVAQQLEVFDLLERRIETLSGGQRQRVFLARALVTGSPFLLLDEPATFLDLKHQVDLHRRLKNLTRELGKTVLMASHDLNLVAAHADRMILLHEGRIAAQGTPSEVLDPDLISRVFETPMKRIDVDGRPMLVAVGN